MDGTDVTTGAAWRSFCDRIGAAGDRILADDFPADARDRAEGVRHLATQVACWLTYTTGYTDPAYPAFFRSSDPVYLWGGPNVDQVARRAAIAGDGSYRVSGHMGACEEFVLQVKLGKTQSGGADVSTEIYASQLGLCAGDDFEILLSAHEQPGHWFALDPDATFVHVRDYYFDWQPREPATFVIERLDTQGLPPHALTPDRVAAMLDDAAHEIEHSVGRFVRRRMTLDGVFVYSKPRTSSRRRVRFAFNATVPLEQWVRTGPGLSGANRAVEATVGYSDRRRP